MSVKTADGLAIASVKTVNGLAIASVKTVDDLTVSAWVTYATRNSSDKSADITLSGSDLIATATTTAWKSVRGNIGKSSWKRYREITVWATGTDFMQWIGNSSATLANHVWFDANWWCYYSNAGVSAKYTNNVSSWYGSQYWAWVIISVYLDMDAGTIWFYRNWVDKWTAYTWLSGTIYPMVSPYATGASYTANFGATAFTYSPPVWFNSWLYT